MCDYSLMSLPNRLAVNDEELVSHRFSTGAMGFTSPAELQPMANPGPMRPFSFKGLVGRFVQSCKNKPVTAVCIPPGASLLLSDIPMNLRNRWGAGTEERVTFHQTVALENEYRDAIVFGNGRRASLQELSPGIRARVLSLSCSEQQIEELEERALFERSRDL